MFMYTHMARARPRFGGEIKALAGPDRSNSGCIHDAEPLNGAASHTTPFDRRPTRLGVSEPEQTAWLAHGGGSRRRSRSLDKAVGRSDLHIKGLRPSSSTTMGSGGKRRGGAGGRGGGGSGVVAPVVLLGSGAALWAALHQGPAQGAGASGTAELGAAAAKVRCVGCDFGVWGVEVQLGFSQCPTRPISNLSSDSHHTTTTTTTIPPTGGNPRAGRARLSGLPPAGLLSWQPGGGRGGAQGGRRG